MPEALTQEPTSGVLDALRRLNGRATLADVVAATGQSRDTTEQALRELLGSHRGHLAVGEKGDLVFEFDPELVHRDHESAWSRFKRSAKRFLKGAFKIWIVVMLVAYFVLFVVLAIAAIVALVSGDRRGGSRRRSSGMRLPTWWLWYLFWTNNWRWNRPYYGHQWERRHGLTPEKGGAPFYKKVFAFVFGPDEPRRTQEQRDREIIALIRARRGVLTTSELMAHSGWTRDESSEQLARLMAAHNGDVQVSENAQLIYTFPELMLSAHGPVYVAEPPPAWRRLERLLQVTGNSSGTNAVVVGMNGFNLLASLSAPWTIFPTLGIGGPVAMSALVWVPLVFSAVFFSIPLIRRISVRRENAKRLRRNIRRVLMGRVQEASIRGEALTPDATAAAIRAALEDKTIGDHIVADELGRLATDFDADVEPSPNGGVAFRFPALHRELQAGERTRTVLALERRRVGAIVYSTSDDASDEARRELASFDAELRRRLPSMDRPTYEDFDIAEDAKAR